MLLLADGELVYECLVPEILHSDDKMQPSLITQSITPSSSVLVLTPTNLVPSSSDDLDLALVSVRRIHSMTSTYLVPVDLITL